MPTKLNIPTAQSSLLSLRAGEEVLVSGVVFVARDAAHRRIVAALESGADLPFDLNNACIYYAGPAPAREGEVIGVCGPTSSTRMDAFTPRLLERGLSITIGKGNRSKEVVDAMRGRAVYLLAVGGAAALYQSFITECETIAYPELGCEAVLRLVVKDMPLLVGIDAFGSSVFERDLG